MTILKERGNSPHIPSHKQFIDDYWYFPNKCNFECKNQQNHHKLECQHKNYFEAEFCQSSSLIDHTCTRAAAAIINMSRT